MWSETSKFRSLRDRIEAASLRLLDTLPVPAESVGRPVLVIMSGLPGTGKSYVAEAISRSVGSVVVRSDSVRKMLFGQPHYTPAENGIVHQVCHAAITALLGRGKIVVFDATNLAESHRRVLYRLAAAAGGYWMVVVTVAPEELILERLQERESGLQVNAYSSDATREVYYQFKDKVEPVRMPHHVVDSSGDPTEVMRGIVRDIVNATHGREAPRVAGQTRESYGEVPAEASHTGENGEEGDHPE